MSPYLRFRYSPDTNSPRSLLVVAAMSSEFDESSVRSQLDDDFRTNLRPEGVLVLAPERAKEAFKKGLQDAVRPDSAFRFDTADTCIDLLCYDHVGRLSSTVNICKPGKAFSASVFREILNQGILDIVERRHVAIQPGPGMHFVHPSGVHSGGFVRAANALVQGAEISFLALTLLPHLEGHPIKVWVDTSSICSLVYAMFSLRQQLDPQYTPPTVESFSSYDGMQSALFEHGDKSLFLISATASGNLSRRIVQFHGVAPNRVVNLFSAARDTHGLVVHFDLLRAKSRHRLPSLQTIAPENCSLCKDGSRAIRLVGDQFLADSVSYTPQMVLISDAPSRLGVAMKNYACREAFRLECLATQESHRIWIDVERLLQDSTARFKQRILDATSRFVPVSVSHLITLDDDASRNVGGVVLDKIREHREITLISKIDEVQNASGIEGVAIVTGCIGSGNQLQSMSRDLRDALGDRPRVYLTGFAKYAAAERQRALKSDLVFNGQCEKHEMVVLQELALPIPANLTTWRREEQFLKTLLEDSSLDKSQVWLQKRIDVLGCGKISVNNLFWESPVGMTLNLRRGFAFWPGIEDSTHGSQSDVFVTIVSVLENMRTACSSAGAEPKLLHTAFHCNVLSPANFGRYNDGVIQAAFLRAALPHELNYSARVDLSGEMARIVERAVDLFDVSQGEAVGEFLLALATKRLALAPSDIERLRGMATNRPAGFPEVLRYLLSSLPRDHFHDLSARPFG